MEMTSITKFAFQPTQFLFFVLLLKTSSSEEISITCNAGTFVGRVKTQEAFNHSYTVNRFLGIPYAEPPIGKLRFSKPVKKAPLTKPYDAGDFGASCYGIYMDIEGKRKPDQFNIVESEDCLFLNIFTPNIGHSKKKLPVLLFIYGGGFNLGTSTIYPGDILSSYGEVVVVTINYRLNIWGFLSTGDDASPGNYGLWDQQLAIEWVHENIAAFGGDPDLVTINGYSAGSASVIYQAMYPGNKGLFKRLFAQSGSPLCPWAFNKNPRETAYKVGRLLECAATDTHELVRCIKSKSAVEIMTSLNKDEVMLIFPMELVTVVDAEFVKHPPAELLNEASPNGIEERELFSNYDLLTGVTTHDGIMMVNSFVGVHGTETFSLNTEKFNKTEVPKIARVMFPEDNSEAMKNLLMNEYFPFHDPENDTVVRDAFVQLSTDYVFGIQAARTAKVHSILWNKNTYFYLFNTLPSQHLLATPSWSDKPNHCDDLTFLFGHDSDSGFTSWTMPYTGEPPENWEFEFTKQYMKMLTNFMKSGNPTSPDDVSSQAKVTWPKYTPDKQEAFIITRDWDQPVVQRPFAKAMNFWYNALPSVVREIKNMETGYCVKPDS